MILDKYQYKGLKYQIITGDKKAILDEHIVSCKVGIPLVNWTLRFKNVSSELKDYIESITYDYQEDLILKSHINPRFRIFRDTRATRKYYLTYEHEYRYYNTAVNRSIPFTNDGTNDILEGGIIIPVTIPTEGIVVPNNTDFSRKVYYLETKNTVTHEAYKIHSFSIRVKDIAKPVSQSVIEYIGASDVAYVTNC